MCSEIDSRMLVRRVAEHSKYQISIKYFQVVDNWTSGPVNTYPASALQLLNPKTGPLMDGPGTGDSN